MEGRRIGRMEGREGESYDSTVGGQGKMGSRTLPGSIDAPGTV
jgi:hypothetical protein